MFKFSKKRFLITLGLSVAAWLASGLFQALTNKGAFGSYVFGAGCDLTGYPLATCVSVNNHSKFLLIAILNVALWFLVINFVGYWFRKRTK